MKSSFLSSACQTLGFLIGIFFATIVAAANPLDPIIAREQQKSDVKLTPMPVVSDAVFLRRIYVDLIGRIPTAAEVTKFAGQPAETRRAALVDELLKDERFADRWTLFFADMLRLRTQATGGAALFAWVHNAVKTGMPYDEMCRKLIATNGKAGRVPEAGFVLGDNADPLAMASITSQVFLGVRMGCAQCHDHPFDKWKRRDFYDLAAYYGKTRRFESQFTNVVIATEDKQSTIMWPPEDEAAQEKRVAIPPRFPFSFDGIDGKTNYLTRLQKSRDAKKLVSKPRAQALRWMICSTLLPIRWPRRPAASSILKCRRPKPRRTFVASTFKKVCINQVLCARNWRQRSLIPRTDYSHARWSIAFGKP